MQIISDIPRQPEFYGDEFSITGIKNEQRATSGLQLLAQQEKKISLYL